MAEELEPDLGEQPLAGLLLMLQLKAHDLVAASSEHLTHKMVARACRGRRLTPNVQGKGAARGQPGLRPKLHPNRAVYLLSAFTPSGRWTSARRTR